MENEIERGRDLRLLKIGIWFISVLSGLLRFFIASQFQMADYELEKIIILGYFFMPLTIIFQGPTLLMRSLPAVISVKFSAFHQFLIHLFWVLFLLFWTASYIFLFGWQHPLVVVASAMDLAIVVLLIAHLMNEEPPRYTY
jgi:hypothetical protein